MADNKKKLEVVQGDGNIEIKVKSNFIFEEQGEKKPEKGKIVIPKEKKKGAHKSS